MVIFLLRCIPSVKQCADGYGVFHTRHFFSNIYQAHGDGAIQVLARLQKRTQGPQKIAMVDLMQMGSAY